MTDEGRRKQIEKALAARADKEPAERHSHPLPWRGDEEYFPVIDLPLDVPLLNADSHRIRAELEAPEFDFVRKDRTSDRAQKQLASLWEGAHRKFDQLKESLSIEGQTEPGVITRAGVLVNGNTRLVALRELNDPGRQWIRLAVLPGDATPLELAKLELRLQVRDPLRDPYKLSNELLFVEEMAREHKMSDEQIAQALGWNPSRPAIGKRNVSRHRRILQLIREMQRRDPKLPIVFFDDKLQHLKELEQRYGQLVEAGENEQAGLLLDTWLVVGRGGYSSVHQIRAVTSSDDFVGEYLAPRLFEQEQIGGRAAALIHGKQGKSKALPGVDDLETDGIGHQGTYDLKPLIRLVEKGEDDMAAVSGAIKGAISDWDADSKAENEFNAPVEALRTAARELRKATEAYSELHGTKEFEHTVRGDFDYQLKQVHKQLKKLDELMTRESAKVG
jgi:hypothetical protein